jgi:hypothetical protein
VHAQPNVQAFHADVHALYQQRHDARPLGGEQFVPPRVELLQGRWSARRLSGAMVQTS